MKRIYTEKYEYTQLTEGMNQYAHLNLRENTQVEALYRKNLVPEYNGNRFIEALPPPRSKDEAKETYRKPITTYDYDKESSISSEQRELLLYRLRDVRIPLPFQVQLERIVYNALCESYRVRYRLEDGDIGCFDLNLSNGPERSCSRLLGDSAAAANAGFALLGYSGSGKSSTLEILLSNYPQVIFHHANDYRIPQIVYLVVNCVPNSNFAALYAGIGNAIDRALGLDFVYEKEISRAKSLGDKAEKVRQLVERFAIGLIVFDEIQLIDFSSTKENSFESLMVLTNRTKVAIGVVGTTDAYEKMFKDLRTARRIGATVSSCQYCNNKEYFSFMVKQLMFYQWFDSPVEITEEIISALYDNTRGIVDQLVSLYIYMHIEYLSMKKRPKVNGKFINLVAKKYFPHMKELLATIDDPLNDQRVSEMLRETKQSLAARADQTEQALAMQDIIESQTAISEINSLERNVVERVMDCTEDYCIDTIHDAFVKVINKHGAIDERTVTREVFKLLQKGKSDKRPKPKSSKKITHEAMQAAVIDMVV